MKKGLIITLSLIGSFVIGIGIVFGTLYLVNKSKNSNSLPKNAEEIKLPIEYIYNEEAYVIEEAPESSIKIVIQGSQKLRDEFKKENEKIVVDLSKTKPSDKKIKIKLNYNKVKGVRVLDDTLELYFREKVSRIADVVPEFKGSKELIDTIDSVEFHHSEVVIKGSAFSLDHVDSVKAIINCDDLVLAELGLYEVETTLQPCDKNGFIVPNVEVIPKTVDAYVKFGNGNYYKYSNENYTKSVPIEVKARGKLVPGKAISNVTINGKDVNQYNVNITGSEYKIKDINYLPITINVDGLGNKDTEFTVNPAKPSGVKNISEKLLKVKVSFGDAETKYLDLQGIIPMNLDYGLKANIVIYSAPSVEVTATKKNLENFDSSMIHATVDLAGLGVGDHEVPIWAECPVYYTCTVSEKLTVRISN